MAIAVDTTDGVVLPTVNDFFSSSDRTGYMQLIEHWDLFDEDPYMGLIENMHWPTQVEYLGLCE